MRAINFFEKSVDESHEIEQPQARNLDPKRFIDSEPLISFC